MDGACTFADEPPRIHRVPAPIQAELPCLLHTIASRVTPTLVKQGLLIRDHEAPCLDLEPADEFEQLLGAAIHHRIATPGRKALTLTRTHPKLPFGVESPLNYEDNYLIHCDIFLSSQR